MLRARDADILGRINRPMELRTTTLNMRRNLRSPMFRSKTRPMKRRRSTDDLWPEEPNPAFAEALL